MSKESVYNSRQYGLFVKNKSEQPKVFCGVYSKDRKEVYIITDNLIYDANDLTNVLMKTSKHIGCSAYSLFNIQNNMHYVNVYYDYKLIEKFFTNKDDDFSCSLSMLKQNEKNINKALEKFLSQQDVNIRI